MAVNDAYFDDTVLDAALGVIDNATKIYLTSSLVAPGSTDAAADAAALAPAVVPSFTGPAAGTPSGRQLIINTAAFAVDTNGTAVAFCLSDGVTVLYSQELSSTQAVLDTQSWTLPAVTVTLPDYDAA